MQTLAGCPCDQCSFFKEIKFGYPPLAIDYVDGGLGYNNPSELALREAAKYWPDSKHFCLVSIGTGHQKAKAVVSRSEEEKQRYFLEQLRSTLPDLGKRIPLWSKGKTLKLVFSR